MINPLFWLGFSILLVAVSLTVVLVVALPTLQELARAARSAEKLFDTLEREFPPTLEAIRLSGLEISELTHDLDQGVKSASGVVGQVEQGFSGASQQLKNVQNTSKSVVTGFKAAWKTFNRSTENSAVVSESEDLITYDQSMASEVIPSLAVEMEPENQSAN